jgi:uncharacterized repeat protein (TIGR04042 family)
MTMVVRWPDGREQAIYSPSLVVHEHLSAGQVYRVADFEARAGHALAIAGERVRALRGFTCTAAAASIEAVTRAAARFEPGDPVEVVRMWPAPPGDAG